MNKQATMIGFAMNHVTSLFKRTFAIPFWVLASLLIMVSSAVVVPSPATVDLGTAGNFVILAKSGITTTGYTWIIGDIGVSPAAAGTATGFGLTLDGSGTFSTSSYVVGSVYAANYADPTPAMLTAAVSAMEAAYTSAAGRTPPVQTELGSGDITGQILTTGIYKWSSGVLVSAGGVTLSGSASDVWIFQIAQGLTIANGAVVTLSGGARASNVFWQVAQQVTIGTTAVMKGNILCYTLIAMQAGAKLEGRALSQAQVTLIADTLRSEPDPLIDISIAGGTTFSIGHVVVSRVTESTSDILITNNSNVSLDLWAYSIDATGWTPATSEAQRALMMNKYLLEMKDAESGTYQIIDATGANGTLLINNEPHPNTPPGQIYLKVRLTAPSSVSNHTQHAITVYVIATQH